MQIPLGTQAGNELIWTTSDPADKKLRHVYFGLAHFGSYRADDLKARNILVGLVGATKVSRSAIAQAFGVNRCLVPRYAQELLSHGVEGVVQDGRGRKSKITPEIKGLVGREFRKLYRKSRRNFTAKLISKVKAAYGVELSRELIRQIIQPIRTEINSGAQAAPEKRRGRRVSSSNVPAKVEDNGGNGAALVRALRVGFYSRYGGGLLLNVFVAKLIEGVFGADSSCGGRTFALMVMQMVHFDVINLERVKRLHRGEFGLLVGWRESPTLITMRRNLTEMVEGMDGQQAMVQLARNYIKHLSPESSTFYIDDHFDPYWGKVEVLKGFSNVYHRAMEGTEHCFVHDCAGNPIFFSLRDAYHSFNEVLPYMAERLRVLVAYLGVVVRDPPEPMREVPIDAHCVVCGFRLEWRLVLGKRSSSKSTKLALFFLVFSIIGFAQLAEAEWRLVTRVVDGDTIIVGARERVRLIGVDTRETKHPQKPVEYIGREATAFTKKMVEGKRVRLEFDQANTKIGHKDRYKRTLAYVFLEDGTFLNAEIIKQTKSLVMVGLYSKPNSTISGM